MMPYPCRLALLALLAGGVALAGCSSQPATHPAPAPTGHPSGAGGTSGAVKPRNNAQPSGPAQPSAPAQPPAPGGLPDSTGIPACDDYLASYVACHRVAGIFPPDQIEPRYQAMRTSLLRDSRDPTIRPQLGARCTALAAQLKEALHGKSCNEGIPGPSASGLGSR